jgi:hypothetical protein
LDIPSLLQYAFGKVIETFSHNWALLAISIVIGTLWTGSILIGVAYNLLFL